MARYVENRLVFPSKVPLRLPYSLLFTLLFVHIGLASDDHKYLIVILTYFPVNSHLFIFEL